MRDEYGLSWQRLGAELQHLQYLASAPVRDYTRIEAALAAVQAARRAHNNMRDQLAGALGGAGMLVQVRYAGSSVSSSPEPAKTKPSLITRA